MKVFTLSNFIKKQLKNDDFKLYYDRELLINKIAKIVYELRVAKNLTQAQLAKRIGTSQSSIARLESGNDTRIPSLELLAKIAAAVNAELNISIRQNPRGKDH